MSSVLCEVWQKPRAGIFHEFPWPSKQDPRVVCAGSDPGEKCGASSGCGGVVGGK
jgi:hypothetical protein